MAERKNRAYGRYHTNNPTNSRIFPAISLLSILILFLAVTHTSADRLPNETPENQVFSIDTMLDATGIVDERNSLNWVVASPGSIPTGIFGASQSIADVRYTDTILSNGGKISENKNFGFDSKDKSSSLYNLQTEKVLTYASVNGAHLAGEEQYTLSVAGNFARMQDQIRCVFSSSNGILVPAFCNVVSAKSNLVNLNSGQLSTKGILRATTDSLAPTEMSYRIAVSPDENSGSGTAEGTVATVFAGSLMEARDGGNETWNTTAAERSWKDETTVSGGIRNFQKVFGDPSYQSGILEQGVGEDQELSVPPTPTPTPCTGAILLTNVASEGVEVTINGVNKHISPGYDATWSDLPAGEYPLTIEWESGVRDPRSKTVRCGLTSQGYLEKPP